MFERVASLELRLAKSEGVNQDLSAEVTDLKAVTGQVAALEAHLAELEQNKVDSDARIASLEDENARLAKQVVVLEDQSAESDRRLLVQESGAPEVDTKIATMQQNFTQMKAALRGMKDKMSRCVEKDWIIRHLDQMADDIDRLANKNNQDLRDFADDVKLTLESLSLPAGGGAPTQGHMRGAVSRVHFRCLACDQPMKSMSGPRTQRYTNAVNNTVTMQLGKRPGSANDSLRITKGAEKTIYGDSGMAYRGREDDVHVLHTSEVHGGPGAPRRHQPTFGNPHSKGY